MVRRSKNLSDDDIQLIVNILDGWSGKLTWPLVIEAVERRLHSRYTRQALYKHDRIAAAVELARKALGRAKGPVGRTSKSPVLQLALDRIERLKRENQRLEAENNRLLEQFARWVYNASLRNLDEAFLNQALPRASKRQDPVRKSAHRSSGQVKTG